MTTTLVANAQTIYAAFNQDTQASKAVGALLDYGIRAEDISVISPKGRPEYYRNPDTLDYADGAEYRNTTETINGDGTRVMTNTEGNIDRNIDYRNAETMVNAHNTADFRETPNEDHSADSSDVRKKATSGITTTTGADATVGAEKGAGLGLGVGVLAALACLTVPGFGLVVGGGALATAIAGAAGATAAGAVAGGVHGYLKDQGVPDDAIGSYGEAYDAGDTLIAVTVPSNDVSIVTAHEILSKYNGKHINAF